MSQLRCFKCQERMEHIPETDANGESIRTSIQLFECPNVHCQLWYNVETKQISQYVIWIDRKARYRIRAARDLNQTYLHIKTELKWADHRLSPRTPVYKQILLIPKFKEITFEDNIVQGDLLFEKLQTLLTFS